MLSALGIWVHFTPIRKMGLCATELRRRFAVRRGNFSIFEHGETLAASSVLEYFLMCCCKNKICPSIYFPSLVTVIVLKRLQETWQAGSGALKSAPLKFTTLGLVAKYLGLAQIGDESDSLELSVCSPRCFCDQLAS